MSLFSFKDFYSEFGVQMRAWKGGDLTSYAVYTDDHQKVGLTRDLLVDKSGNFRYLVVEASFGDAIKAVLVPIGLVRFDYGKGYVVVAGLSADRLKRTPSYQSGVELNRGYEQRVRDAYRSIAACRAGHTFLQHPYTVDGRFTGVSSGYTPSAAQDYSHNPTFYGMSDRDNQRPLKRLENRLVSQTHR